MIIEAGMSTIGRSDVPFLAQRLKLLVNHRELVL